MFVGEATYTVRRATGSRTDGVWVRDADQEFTIRGALQPLNGRELELLEEGMRTRTTRKLYTTTELYTARLSPSAEPDRVVADSTEWAVHKVEDWTKHGAGVPHYKCLLVEVGADE